MWESLYHVFWYSTTPLAPLSEAELKETLRLKKKKNQTNFSSHQLSGHVIISHKDKLLGAELSGSKF